MFKRFLDILKPRTRLNNQRGNTIGQAITGLVGLAVTFIPGVNVAWYIGLGVGLTLGGILFPASSETPNTKPSGIDLQTSQYGIAIPVLYGTRKFPGNLLWYSNFQTHPQEESAGGKMGGGATYTTYSYSVSFAFGVCMAPPGDRKTVLNVWAGKNLIDPSRYRIYDGSQIIPDSHIASFLDRAPVWKNLCYVVFENYNLGPYTVIPNFAFEVGSAEVDVSPSNISKDILTNDLYSIGLDTAYLNLDIYAVTEAYCVANDLLVSMLFDTQISVLDALGYIIQHHNGYITYYDGVIAHNQLKTETPSCLLEDEDLKKEEGNYPVEISKAGDRDYNNKIIIEYTRRDAAYVAGTVIADDMVDIDNFRLRDSSIKLDGLCTYGRASAMAWLLLKKSLLKPQGLKFKVGPKSKADIFPGNVVSLTDESVEAIELPIRILTVSEGDRREIGVEAIEENAGIYDISFATPGNPPIPPPELPNLDEPAESVIRHMAIEVPALYSPTCEVYITYSQPVDEHGLFSGLSWAGASIYKAYEAGGSYQRELSNPGSGVTGKVICVGIDNYTAYIDVELDWAATLSPATSFDNLLTTPGKNLFVIDDIFCRFQEAELIAVNQWRLSGLIYDTVGFPKLNTYGSFLVDDEVFFYQGTVNILDIEDADKYRTLYFKTPSFIKKGFEQNLADVSYFSLMIQGLCDKPLPVYDVSINGIGLDSDNAIVIGSGDIILEWFSRNRFNAGGNNYTRSDTIIDDSDFQNFQIEVWRNSTLKRTVTQTAKSWTYTEAMRATDGGAGPITFKIRVIGVLDTSEDEIFGITII
jgi:hypothetical protein